MKNVKHGRYTAMNKIWWAVEWEVHFFSDNKKLEFSLINWLGHINFSPFIFD
jgi:hypothetical protein